ncbi:hypothetical protein Tco_1124833 [Tanacetum coccineum]|uniref:Monodehydroascorbate reductase n=1 Tax=Tanacetum coccineum TaxID=301880 RepID=A0ABQ5JA96_9ASTR
MEISIADQIALDDALVAPADRLKIGKCNLRLSSDVTSKEATLQVVYDVLKLTPFYKAFQVTADAPEIYMQEFWASAYVHNRSVRFKMNNKKHIIGLDQFRDILQICPKVGNKKFVEPPLEKEILIFLASLGHSGDIRKITDVNVNKLHQPWRSFAAIINKCLSGIPSYDSLRLSQAQILWGMYNKKNVDYAYLLWEDFIFKIENKNTKKGSAMYYPRFTKLVVNYVMEKDPSIPRRNKVNWHYARDDPMFTTINVISRNEATQLYGAILPVSLTNEDIRNSESYKEYYARASGTIPPKTKGSKKKANTDAIPKLKPPTAPKEKKSGKGKQKTAELETISEADLTEAEQLKIITKRSRQETHSSHASGSGADEGTGVTPGVPDAPNYDSEDDISWKSSDDDQDDEQAQDDEDADKNDVNETAQDDEDDDDHDDDEKVQDEDDDEHDDDKKAQDDDDEELTESDDDGDDFVHPKLTNSYDEDSDNEDEGTNVEGAKSDEEATYEEDQGNEAVEDTNTDLDGRDDVMTDVILPQVQATQEIEDTHVTLTPVNPDGQQQSSSVSSGFVSNMAESNQAPMKALEDNFSELRQTINYAEALLLIPSTVDQYLANISRKQSEIQRRSTGVSDDAYEADKILLDTYGDTVTIKRPRDGADDDQEPSAGTDRGSKRRRSGKEPASTSAPSETTTKTAGKTTSTGSKTHKKSASQSAPVEEAMQSTDVFKGPADQEFETGVHDEQAEEEVQHLPDWFQQPTRLPSPDHAWNKSVPAVHESVQPWLSNLAQQDPRESFDELTDSTFDFSAFVLNRLNVQTLTPELLAGPTFELMKGTCKSLTELEYFCEEVYKATTEKLDWINPEGRQYPHGSAHPLRKVTNLNVEERIAFNVSLRMFTRRVVIQRRVEDLQLGVESYQKKLNLTKPDTYRSNLRRQDAYTPYSIQEDSSTRIKTRRTD